MTDTLASRLIGRVAFDAAAAADAYWRARWDYTERALAMIAGLGLAASARVLEIGPYNLPLVGGSDRMDRRIWPAGPALAVRHDAGAVPWPIADGAYDLAIALQVWEHLAGNRVRAFSELARVARRAVLSLPYRWTGTSDHAGIDEAVIGRWAGGRRPVRSAVVGERTRRIVLLYDFGGEEA